MLWLISGGAGQYFTPAFRLPGFQIKTMAGYSLFLSGMAAGFWAFWTLKLQKTPVEPFSVPNNLVVNGPYAISRNPLYLAVCVGCAGFSILLDSPWHLIFVLAFVAALDKGVIPDEEKVLESEFPERYISYKRSVRRWL